MELSRGEYSHREFSRGYLIALASSVILSTTAIFIRYLTVNYQVPALVLAFWRDVFVVATLLLVLGFLRPALLRASPSSQRYLILYGLALAFFNALWTLSVALNGAAVATVLVYCSAAFTALLACWLLKERLDWVKIIVILLCLGGCVLVAEAYQPDAWRVNWVGILTGTLAGLGYAIYSLMGRSASQRGLNPWTTLFYTFGYAALFLLVVNLLLVNLLPGTASQPADLFWLGSDPVGWVILILLAAGPTVAGFGLYNVSLSLLPASIANLVLTTEPVFTATVAYFLLGESLSPMQLVGSLLILAGVVLLRVNEGRLMRKSGAVQQNSITA